MKDKKECCEKMTVEIKAGTIIVINNLEYIHSIRGKPSLVNDGGGHFDDMTDEIDINYCPFCGKKLGEQNER